MIEQDATDLFAEMDEIADLRNDPLASASGFPLVVGWEGEEPRGVRLPIGTGDLFIAFRELRKRLLPDFSDEGWLEVVESWCEHDEARRGFEQAAEQAYRALLWEERRKLFVERTFLPQDSESLRAIDERLLEIGTVVADALPDADVMAEVCHKFVD